MNLTAEEILEQKAFYNNLGLHLSANFQVREFCLSLMELYTIAGGDPQKLIDQAKEFLDNDFSLQLNAGWLEVPLIEAMEEYNNQSSDGFRLSFNISSCDTVGTLVVNNLEQYDFDIKGIFATYQNPPNTSVVGFKGGQIAAGSNISIPLTAPSAPDNLYQIGVVGNSSQDFKSYQTIQEDVSLPCGGSPVVISLEEMVLVFLVISVEESGGLYYLRVNNPQEDNYTIQGLFLYGIDAKILFVSVSGQIISGGSTLLFPFSPATSKDPLNNYTFNAEGQLGDSEYNGFATITLVPNGNSENIPLTQPL